MPRYFSSPDYRYNFFLDLGCGERIMKSLWELDISKARCG
jgi:hypothetical protein